MRRKGQLIERLSINSRDVQIFHSLGLALIHLNWDTMCHRGIQILGSMQKVDDSEEATKIWQRVKRSNL